MVIFLRQEIDRMQKVIVLVRTTLKDLLLAIDGTIIMNEVMNSILFTTVPLLSLLQTTVGPFPVITLTHRVFSIKHFIFCEYL